MICYSVKRKYTYSVSTQSFKVKDIPCMRDGDGLGVSGKLSLGGQCSGHRVAEPGLRRCRGARQGCGFGSYSEGASAKRGLVSKSGGRPRNGSSLRLGRMGREGTIPGGTKQER